MNKQCILRVPPLFRREVNFYMQTRSFQCSSSWFIIQLLWHLWRREDGTFLPSLWQAFIYLSLVSYFFKKTFFSFFLIIYHMLKFWAAFLKLAPMLVPKIYVICVHGLGHNCYLNSKSYFWIPNHFLFWNYFWTSFTTVVVSKSVFESSYIDQFSFVSFN